MEILAIPCSSLQILESCYQERERERERGSVGRALCDPGAAQCSGMLSTVLLLKSLHKPGGCCLAGDCGGEVLLWYCGTVVVTNNLLLLWSTDTF